MKVLHRSKYRNSRGQVSTLHQLQITVQHGSNWKHAFGGEDRVAGLLARHLDDHYTLIRNVTLPGEADDLDMVLVGPTGVWEFEILQFRGSGARRVRLDALGLRPAEPAAHRPA
jgi:hypothetical protein